MGSRPPPKDGVIGWPARGKLKILGAARQADGETRSGAIAGEVPELERPSEAIRNAICTAPCN